MNERLPIQERPVTKSREAFIEALKSLPILAGLPEGELADALDLATDLLADIASFGELVSAEITRRTADV